MPKDLLKTVFGHDHYRDGQSEIVNAIISGKDVLAIMPTGGGKSLCFQLPALTLKGIVLVVSPLIALMRDQVSALKALGVNAGALTSGNTNDETETVFNDLEKDTNQYNDIIEIFWASGACFFIRSEVYHLLNGFDEDYFAHQEEVDLCWRAQNEGYDIKYVGSSSVYHIGGATLQETNPQKTFLNFRNSLLNVIKNVPKQWFLFVVFSRLVLDGVAGIKFLVEFRPIHTWAIVRAHISVYKNFYKFLQKRKKLQKKYNYNLHTSVVWQYFILRRRQFKNLR